MMVDFYLNVELSSIVCANPCATYNDRVKLANMVVNKHNDKKLEMATEYFRYLENNQYAKEHWKIIRQALGKDK